MHREKRADRRRGGARRKRRVCGGSRLWIFLLLGALVEVLGLVVGGIYLNVRSLTSSLQHTQILPTYVSVAAVLLTGLFVLLLFWKRLHVLVFVTSVISVGVGLLCGGSAVLTATHIIRPMMHFSQCSLSRDQCRCLSPYSRHQLSLQYSQQAMATYVYGGVSSCSVVQRDLIHMLFALCAVYGVIFIVCVVVAVLALLAYRTERLHRPSVESDSCEEIFTVSNSSSTPSSTDQHVEHDSDQPGLHLLRSARREPRSEDGEPGAGTDFIYSPSDIPLDYNEACRMRQRSHSFSQPRRQNQSFDSTESTTAYASSTLGRGEDRRHGGEGQGRLKEHRRRARRAVTLANLDHQQLMLIMSLQLRYLQESQADRQFHLNNTKLEQQTRRALTPTPRHESFLSNPTYSDVDIRPVKLVQSPTSQPAPTSNTHQQAPSSTPTSHYENEDIGSLVDYENVDGCVPTLTSSVASGQPGMGKTVILGSPRLVPAGLDHTAMGEGRRISKTPVKSYRTAMSAEPVSPKVRNSLSSGGGATHSLTKAQEESGYVVMQSGMTPFTRGNAVMQKEMTSGGVLQGGMTSKARANSYENVDNLSSCGIPSSAHRDPLYENQKESLAARRLRQRASSCRQQQDSATAAVASSLPQAALPQGPPDRDHPARPKSYIKAVEGVECEGGQDAESSTLSDDSEREDFLPPNSASKHHHSQPSLTGPVSPYAPMQSYPAQMLASAPAVESQTVALDWGRHLGGGCTEMDTYAQPKKKGRPLPPRPGLDGEGGGGPPFPLLGHESGGRSAFHKVMRPPPPPPPYLGAPCDTDLDDLDPLPQPRSRKKVSRAPPYSAPPSYECLVSSRHGSVHSLASSSSHTTDNDLDSDLYRQIRKGQSGAGRNGVKSVEHSPHVTTSPFLPVGHQGHQGNGLGHVDTNGKGQGRPSPASWGGYYYNGDHAGIHSFPFRKHHPSSATSLTSSQKVSTPKLASVRSYENLDDVFDSPPSHRPVPWGMGLSQGRVDVTSSRGLDMNSNQMSYEDIVHLATGKGEDSDSEFMETVI